MKQKLKKHKHTLLWTALTLTGTIFGPIAFYLVLYTYFGPTLSTLE